MSRGQGLYQHNPTNENPNRMANLGTLSGTTLIFGGPYSNFAATAAMRQRAGKLGIAADHVICTGDLVAYCAEPAQTLDLVRDWGIQVVMGNCEESFAANQPDCGCGFEPGSRCSTLAVAWYRYADQRVSVQQRRWMQAMPRCIEFEIGGRGFKVIHASLSSLNEFVFASSGAESKRAQILEAGVDVIVGGHSGIPFGQDLGDGWWLNAGVIGMPANDGGPHGWYMLIDQEDDDLIVSWHRLDYEHALSRHSTVAAGIAGYGEALADGLWPSMDVLPSIERAQRGQPLDLPSIRI